MEYIHEKPSSKCHPNRQNIFKNNLEASKAYFYTDENLRIFCQFF